MKTLLLFLCLLFPVVGKSQGLFSYPPMFSTPVYDVEDGVYDALAKYSTSRDYTTAFSRENSFEVEVVVKDKRVICINFANGGQVHIGPNNEGYEFTGGTLLESGQKVITRVIIDDGRMYKYYSLKLM